MARTQIAQHDFDRLWKKILRSDQKQPWNSVNCIMWLPKLQNKPPSEVERTHKDPVQNSKANAFGFSSVDCGAGRKSERQSGKTRPAWMPLAIDMTEKKNWKTCKLCDSRNISQKPQAVAQLRIWRIYGLWFWVTINERTISWGLKVLRLWLLNSN